MEKAFDNVKWNALLCILNKHGFGEKWIDRLHFTSSNISVLVNGSSSEKFSPTNGSRQGDSLSPFLFLLVVEVLSKMLEDAVQRRQIHGFVVAENGIHISHLQFADDTLISLNAEKVEVRRLLLILSTFEMLTGIKLILDKSSMISVGADVNTEELVLELGCKAEAMPIKYLGLHLGVTTRSLSIWDDVIQRMKNVEMKLTRIMRNFLCDSAEDRRKMCRVSWKKILYPATYKVCKDKNASISEMICNGRLHCNTKRSMSDVEQVEWNLLCNELGPVPEFVDEEDGISYEDAFTVKRCYERQLETDGEHRFQKYLWKKQVPSKVSFLLWAYMHDSVPTLTMLQHRGNNVASVRCHFCQEEDEDSDHLFCRLGGRSIDVWEKIHYIIFWILWKERCGRSFGARHKTADKLILLIKQNAVLWLHEKST
ncbi:uncharacterized protein LOC113304133 [Papaver somniferum]|uniref:uncharacterized protein LOC113304133 n=1 Tax=Papaver somniferum TaxID=3469 RepID=UPI000E6F9C60|nr:uncharacterized protein LOC113304133 [Papaver somniferum]